MVRALQNVADCDTAPDTLKIGPKPQTPSPLSVGVTQHVTCPNPTTSTPREPRIYWGWKQLSIILFENIDCDSLGSARISSKTSWKNSVRKLVK